MPAQPGIRSRRGCLQCRRGHHKCDESLPVCARCRYRGLACEYNHVRWGCMFTAESMKRGPRGRPRPRAVEPTRDGEPRGPDDDNNRHAVMTPVSSHTASPPAARESRESLESLEEQEEEDHSSHVICSPSLAVCEPAPACSVLAPLFQDADEAAAYSYYVERLAGDIQALDSLDNPYRKLSVVALSHPVLLYTIISCAAEHMHLLGRYPIDRAISQHTRAIRAIRVQLETWHVPRTPSRAEADTETETETATAGRSPVSDYNCCTGDQALLMAVLLQPAVVAFSHCDGPSAESYLDIGFYMLQEHGYLGPSAAPWAMESYFARLLVQRFAIVDLGVSIFRRRRPHLLPSDWFASPAQSDRLDGTRPSFRDMVGSSHAAFVHLLRAAHLAMDLEEEERPHRQIYSDAIALETDIRIYDARLAQGGPGPDSKTVSHVTAVCRAFAHTAQLLLLRRCFREPSSSPRVQHAVSCIFGMIDVVPVTTAEGTSDPQQVRSGLDSSTCMPFYLAAREAQSEEDRDWVRRKNRLWRQVYPMPARGLLLEVAERIWEERQRGGENMEERCRQIEESCKAYVF